MTRSAKFGNVVICLFALPFAFGGLAAVSKAIQIAQSDQGHSSVWPLFLIGTFFVVIGFGLVFATFYGTKLMQRQQRLQVEHPTEPWLWREDWAQGKVQSKTRGSAIAGWIFTIFWNAVSMPMAYLFLTQPAKVKGPAVFLILVFPVIGVGLLIRAIRQTIALLEFGKTCFEMSSVPGVIGRELRGQIQARFPHSPDHGIHLRLSCVHRVTTNSGNSSNTSERILWRDEAELSSAQLFPGPSGTMIPVAFHIPLDAQPTEKRNSRDEFVWVLEALADVPGVNYHDIFEVPVFRTPQTPAQPEARRFVAAPPTFTRPTIMTVEVRQNADETEFYFSAARNKKLASSVAAAWAICGVITYSMIHHAPVIFPIFFGLFSLILFYSTVQQWLSTTRVVVGSAGVAVQSGWLGSGKTHQIPLQEIASINHKISAQQGGATGTPYYDIELTLRNGIKITLGRAVREKPEAEWIVQEMRRLAGLQAKSLTAGMA
jgi:hypothetical protein